MNYILDLIKQTLRGKSLQRTLFNWKVFEHCQNLKGIMIDLGAGEKASYRNYWKIEPTQFIRADMDPKTNPDVIADLNRPLPFGDNFADYIFLFNVLYIIKKPDELLKEISQILKPGGILFLYSPFIFNESREPNDFFRFTSEGLEKLLKEANFREFQIIPVGERFSAACNLIDKIFVFNFLKVPPRLLALLLDKIWPQKLKNLHPCPIGYFAKVKK